MCLSDAEAERLSGEQFLALAERCRERERRADYRAALIASVLANVNRDAKKRSEPFTPFEFMPDPWPREAPLKKPGMTPEEMFEIAKAVQAGFDARDP